MVQREVYKPLICHVFGLDLKHGMYLWVGQVWWLVVLCWQLGAHTDNLTAFSQHTARARHLNTSHEHIFLHFT